MAMTEILAALTLCAVVVIIAITMKHYHSQSIKDSYQDHFDDLETQQKDKNP